MTRDRDAWKFILKEARVLRGPPSGAERVGRRGERVGRGGKISFCCFQEQEKTNYELQEEM